jgi:tRNA/tmRNA/rRNA uracil-C5-methylase (TrmA/RlmC/RlmD family)
MTIRISLQSIVSVLLLGLTQLGYAASKLPEVTEDGLELRKVKGIDVVYVRPGATLAAYKRVMLDPVEVAFSKDWDPEKTGSRMKLSPADREKLRTELAALFDKTFKEELEKKNGYPVVTEAAADVLRVTPALIDVYANAPDTMQPGRSVTFTVSAGRATLIAELRDSETGAILARVADARETRNDGFMQVSSSVSSSAEARNLISQWARVLRKRLDAVREVPASGD